MRNRRPWDPGGHEPTGTWRERIAARLPLLGHRNWIVIADSAYPEQSNPGSETVYAGGDQIEAVRSVLEMVDASKHVRPTIFLDAELPHVLASDAAGIGEYRDRLKATLADRPTESLPHEEIIAKLDEDAKAFSVLIIKTDMVLPYTSVFLRLECGYWSADAEARLRKHLK
jgi:hypothetical protein